MQLVQELHKALFLGRQERRRIDVSRDLDVECGGKRWLPYWLRAYCAVRASHPPLNRTLTTSVSILQKGKLTLREKGLVQSHTANQVQIEDLGAAQGRVRPHPPAPGTDPKVGGCEAVGGRHVGGGGGMCVIGIDVGKQGAHDGRYPGTHVLGGEAGKVAGGKEWEALGLLSSQERPQHPLRMYREWLLPTSNRPLTLCLTPSS